MEVTKPENEKQLHLSGAYIRSLVRQLTSSRPVKQPTENPEEAPADGTTSNLNQISQRCSGGSQKHQETGIQPQPKKQVRRRLHTVKPYQGRPLNMAEARREIVAALKLHRAAMKRADEQKQRRQQLETTMPYSQQVPCLSQPAATLEGQVRNEVKPSWNNVRAYPSNSSAVSNEHRDSSSDISSLSSNFYPPFPDLFQYPIESFIDDFKLPFPIRPLGLNLNLHDFNDFKNELIIPGCGSNSNPQTHSSSCSNSWNYPPDYGDSTPEVVSASEPPLLVSEVSTEEPADEGLHPALSDEEIAQIRLIGERHEVEWNDTMNLVTSAWWFKFLETSERNSEGLPEAAENIIAREPDNGVLEGSDGVQLSSELPGADPATWLSFPQHTDDHFRMEGFLQDAFFPR